MSDVKTNAKTSAFGEAPINATSSFSRPAALIGGATVLVAITAIATTLAVRSPAQGSGAGLAPVAGAEMRGAALASQQLLAANNASKSNVEVITEKRELNDGDEPAAAKPAPAAKPAKAAAAAPRAAKPAAGTASAKTVAAAVAACDNCGVIEAVTPFEQKGEGSGLGAVAGGVLGGVVGHQAGGGNGKKAMTVLGAIGGGMAGHEIEKRQRATTMYSVKVRMADGTLRTVTQPSAPTVGQKVTVEGAQIKARA